LTSATLVKVPQAHSQVVARASTGEHLVNIIHTLTKESRANDPIAKRIKAGAVAALNPQQFSPVVKALNHFAADVKKEASVTGQRKVSVDVAISSLVVACHRFVLFD